MKTSELTDELLDYWVAKAEGFALSADGANWDICLEDAPTAHGCGATLNFSSIAVDKWKPSTDHAQGGPIIDREQISVIKPFGKDQKWIACEGFRFRDCGLDGFSPEGRGKTSLIAAMRCRVASKYGDEVPDDPAGASNRRR